MHCTVNTLFLSCLLPPCENESFCKQFIWKSLSPAHWFKNMQTKICFHMNREKETNGNGYFSFLHKRQNCIPPPPTSIYHSDSEFPLNFHGVSYKPEFCEVQRALWKKAIYSEILKVNINDTIIPYPSLRSQYLQHPETPETFIFTLWTTFWKLVIFLYAPFKYLFSNFMYISQSLLLNLHRNILTGDWLENPWLLKSPDSYSTLSFFLY